VSGVCLFVGDPGVKRIRNGHRGPNRKTLIMSSQADVISKSDSELQKILQRGDRKKRGLGSKKSRERALMEIISAPYAGGGCSVNRSTGEEKPIGG